VLSFSTLLEVSSPINLTDSFSSNYVFEVSTLSSSLSFLNYILSSSAAVTINDMSSSLGSTKSVSIRLEAFPPLELRNVAPWTEINLSEYSNESEESGATLQMGKSHVAGISILQTVIIICNVSCIMLFNSMLGGLLVVGLPTIAKEIGLKESLLLWPICVTS
jgi:hypothetical protein